ncbi:hypothetical protein RA993_23100, partial [Mycobacteroides abscessus subsp. abscessus]
MLLGGIALTAIIVALMRVLIPKVRPSLAMRTIFARNMFRPPHVVSAEPPDGHDVGELSVDDTFAPPERSIVIDEVL